MNYLDSFDLESTIKDYEFTRKAASQIRQVVTSRSFSEDMSPEEIFQFLFQEMTLVSFKDYLKRYLYERSGMQEPFRNVDDQTWQSIIATAFEENNAPHSLEPTTTRWNATVKSWITSERVRRSTVFLLGFGLRMSVEDVSDFLTKVLREDDFRMEDPTEVIYRFCYLHVLPWAKANNLLNQYESLPAGNSRAANPDNCLEDESHLLTYLASLKGTKEADRPNTAMRSHYEDLFRRCLKKAAEIYNSEQIDHPELASRTWTPEELSAADLEKVLCNGIPTTESGNLMKANLSLLARHFQSFRPSRQRMEGILKGQLNPDRYDLITFTFFLHSEEGIPGEERLQQYLDETDAILKDCHLAGLYSANAYDAFLLICILSESPLALYGDIWELSYQPLQED